MKKIIYKYRLLILLFNFPVMVSAQTEMQGSQFIFDRTYINPAFSGIDGFANANLHFQINDGNLSNGKSYTISAGANIELKKVKSGLGFNLVKNVFGNDGYSMGYGNYVYHLPLSEKIVLSSGISVGIQQFDINLSNSTTVTANDPLSARNVYSSKFDARFGLVGNFSDKYYVGVSFDNILSLYTNKDSYFNQVPPTFRKINMYLVGGLNLDNKNGMRLQPNILFMKNFGGITALDVNVLLTLNNSFGLGAGFRQRIDELESVATGSSGKTLSQSILRPMLQYHINGPKHAIKIGYCYSFMATQSIGVSRGSHDISLVFNMP